MPEQPRECIDNLPLPFSNCRGDFPSGLGRAKAPPRGPSGAAGACPVLAARPCPARVSLGFPWALPRAELLAPFSVALYAVIFGRAPLLVWGSPGPGRLRMHGDWLTRGCACGLRNWAALRIGCWVGAGLISGKPVGWQVLEAGGKRGGYRLALEFPRAASVEKKRPRRICTQRMLAPRAKE